MPTVDITANDARIQYTASAAQTAFVYDFIIFDQADIVVVKAGSILTLGADDDYTVSGVGAEAGGTVTLTTGATSGDKVTLYRDSTISRGSQYQVDGRLDAAPLERDLDRITTILQEQDRDLKRSIQLDVEDTLTSLTLPTRIPGRGLKWNPAGDGFVNTTLDPDTVATEAAQSATEAAQSATDAATSETNAATSATDAATSETNAETAATNAATSETNAENYAAAYSGTSTTALLIETGSKVFTTQADKLWVDGQFLQIASAADASNYMNGTVTSYTGTTLTMDIETIGGSGTLADWNISISGVRGIQGIQGVQGPTFVGTLTGALNWNTAQTIASAATTNLATATSNYVIVSGTTPITAFGTIAQGAERVVRFSGVLTLTHNATTMILLSGANITTAVGDIATFVSEGAGNWRMTDYVREDGTALVIEADFYQDLGSITGSHTVDLSLGRTIKMTTTGNITLTFSNWLATGSQDAAYLIIVYGGAHTLTLSGITITTAGGAAYAPTASATDRIIIDTQNAGVNGTLNIVGQDYS